MIILTIREFANSIRWNVELSVAEIYTTKLMPDASSSDYILTRYLHESL
jgi:hypothetical protein